MKSEICCEACHISLKKNDFYIFGYPENPIRICYECWEENSETLKFYCQHQSIYKNDHCCVIGCNNTSYVFIHKVENGFTNKMWSLCWNCYDSNIGIDLIEKIPPIGKMPTETEIAQALVDLGGLMTKEEIRKHLNWPEFEF